MFPRAYVPNAIPPARLVSVEPPTSSNPVSAPVPSQPASAVWKPRTACAPVRISPLAYTVEPSRKSVPGSSDIPMYSFVASRTAQGPAFPRGWNITTRALCAGTSAGHRSFGGHRRRVNTGNGSADVVVGPSTSEAGDDDRAMPTTEQGSLVDGGVTPGGNTFATQPSPGEATPPSGHAFAHPRTSRPNAAAAESGDMKSPE